MALSTHPPHCTGVVYPIFNPISFLLLVLVFDSSTDPINSRSQTELTKQRLRDSYIKAPTNKLRVSSPTLIPSRQL